MSEGVSGSRSVGEISLGDSFLVDGQEYVLIVCEMVRDARGRSVILQGKDPLLAQQIMDQQRLPQAKSLDG